MREDPRIEPWETLKIGEVEDHRVFGFQEVVRRSPRTGRTATYKVLHAGPCTNVVARTPDDRLVLVEGIVNFARKHSAEDENSGALTADGFNRGVTTT